MQYWGVTLRIITTDINVLIFGPVSSVVPVFISSQHKRGKLTVHNGLKLKRHTSTARPRSMNKVTTT